jgi:Protein tyrosine and serine/threonine kinase
MTTTQTRSFADSFSCYHVFLCGLAFVPLGYRLILRRYSEKSDVWMFGATLVEMTGREEPLAHMSGLEVGTQTIMHQMRPSPPAACPAAMHATIEACFAWEPSDRPTFAEIMRMLQPV